MSDTISLYNVETGELQPVPLDQAAEALAKGGFKPPADRMNVIQKSGEDATPRSLPIRQLSAGAEQGYRLMGDQEMARYKARQAMSPGEELTRGLKVMGEEVIAGATMGVGYKGLLKAALPPVAAPGINYVSDLIDNALQGDTPATMPERELFPDEAFRGQAVGIAGSIAVPGLGALAAARGTTAIGKGALLATGAAAEAAIYTTANSVRIAEGESDLSAESLLASAGESAGWAAGITGVLGGGGKAASFVFNALTKGSRAVPAIARMSAIGEAMKAAKRPMTFCFAAWGS